MTRARAGLAGLVALVAAAALAWLSQVPTTYARPGDALLRLSWRVPGVRIEQCRPRTQEELEALAPHMRAPEVCTRGFVDHELRVHLDGREVLRDTVQPGGARRDRPVYVYRELPLAPGRHPLTVAFTALVPEGFDPEGATVAYRYEGGIGVAPTEVVLITVDAAGSSLTRVDP